MESFRHAIFDLDGTLVDSLPGIAWSVERALVACGLPAMSADLRPLIGPPIRQILADVTGLIDTLALDRLESAFRAAYDTEGWRIAVCYEGVPRMLRELAASGADLWLITNKPSGVTVRILRELGLERFFQEVVCPDSRTPAFASKAEALDDLLRRRKLARAQCLLIGDTAEDCRTAAAARVACAIVPHGYGQALSPRLPGTGYRLSGWDDLRRLLETQPALVPAGTAGEEVNQHD